MGDGAIGQRNAHPHIMQCNNVGQEVELHVGVVEDVVEDAVDEVTVDRLMLMLPYRCRMQVLLGLLCNRLRV